MDVLDFEHKEFESMEVFIVPEEKRILFSNNSLKKNLDVRNKNLPQCSDTHSESDIYVDLHEVFEYIKYSKINEDRRKLFEEWLEEIILECLKELGWLDEQ